jgi:RecB family exonuclease
VSRWVRQVGESMNFRNLPPVAEKVAAPSRLSMTLLNHCNWCPRSAYLYLRHRGGPSTIEQDRGTAGHLFAEHLARELVVRGEESLYAPAAGEDAVLAAGEVASLTKVMVEAALADRRDLVLPHYEREILREAAFHLAIGWDVDPKTIAGVEQLFVLDLENGWTISGKIDLLSLPDDTTAQIDDYKFSMAVADQETFDNRFQLKLYALLAMFGQPVDVVDGEERRRDPLGQHIRRVQGRELYPRPKLRRARDGALRMVQREATWSRQEIADFRHDVEWVAGVIEHGLKTGEWPARHHQQHCVTCPAEMECPIPRHLRRFAGALDSPEKAAEAWTWAARTSARVASTRAEVKEWSKEHGPVPLQNARVVDHATSSSRSVRRKGKGTDWEGLIHALEDARDYGTSFDVEHWAPERPKTEFKERDAHPGELRGEEVEGDGRGEGPAVDDASAGQRGGERFGDVPF